MRSSRADASCASLALDPLPLILPYNSEKSLWRTGDGVLGAELLRSVWEQGLLCSLRPYVRLSLSVSLSLCLSASLSLCISASLPLCLSRSVWPRHALPIHGAQSYHGCVKVGHHIISWLAAALPPLIAAYGRSLCVCVRACVCACVCACGYGHRYKPKYNTFAHVPHPPVPPMAYASPMMG